MKLAFRQAFFGREKYIVIVDVFSHRFLIFKPLKTDNSLSLKQSVFLTGLSIRNLYSVKTRNGLKVLIISRLVWLSPNIARSVYSLKVGLYYIL